jgi:hypothetical protein
VEDRRLTAVDDLVLTAPEQHPESTSGSAARHRCAAATTGCEGTIEVPLDWANPNDEKITVPFVWLPRCDQSAPAAGTVVGRSVDFPYTPTNCGQLRYLA